MNTTGTIALFFVFAVAGLYGAFALKSTLLKVLSFVVGFGCAQALMLIWEARAGVALLVNAIIFIIVGSLVLKRRSGGWDILFGALLVVVGALSVVPAFESLGTSVPSTILSGLGQAFQQGWDAILDQLERVFIST